MRALAVVFFFLVAACTIRVAAAPPDEEAGLKVRFAVGGESGEPLVVDHPVRFDFALVNESDTVQDFSYTFPPHRVAVIPRGAKEPVWQAFEGRMFPQVMRNETIVAGETRHFTVEWIPVEPGEYRAVAEFNAFTNGRKLAAGLQPETLTIESDGEKDKE